ncbi:MAG: glycosyltransferase [bacterium]|nr:glycosyltransferase [bacterium]
MEKLPQKPVECELKWSLKSKAQWEAWQKNMGCQPQRRLEQVNIYLDTPDGYFAVRRSMLRLRCQNGQWLFVYKRGLSISDGYFSALEIEEPVSSEQAKAIQMGQLATAGAEVEFWQSSRVLQALRDDGFGGTWQVVGEVRNLRQVWPLSLWGQDWALERTEKFELDATFFEKGSSQADYELELETREPELLRPAVEKWALEHGLELCPQQSTKYERFLRSCGVNRPIISCLMPIYNCESTLKQAVRSIIWQTFKSWELILVDDGSTDSTYKLASELAACEPRIRLFRQEHAGIVAALNKAWSYSRAPFVARMDADDISHPQRFNEQLRYLQEHKELAAVGSQVRIFPKRDITEGMLRYERWLNRACSWQALERGIFVESPLVHPSVLMRREPVEQVGLYQDGTWPEDYHLWLRLWINGFQMAKVPRVLFFWRDSPRRLTRIDKRCSHEALRRLKVRFFLQAFFPAESELSTEHEAGAQRSSRALPACKRNLIIWGAGPNGKALAKTLREYGLEPTYFTDIVPARHGQIICGLRVLPFDKLPEPQDYFLVTAVGNPRSRAEIRAFLEERGWKEGRDFCCMAGISDN